MTGRDSAPPVVLVLLGGPEVVCGDCRVAVPEGSKRLVAYLAVHGGRVDPRHAANAIWPDVDRHRAAGNLRSAVWRVRTSGIDIIDTGTRDLALDQRVRIDLDAVSGWADRIVASRTRSGDLDLLPAAVPALDLFPGWYDDWVVLERERLRERMLRAIDTLSALLVAAHRFGDAVEAALSAVGVDPLRESAQRTLIKAHLAEGNICEARRSYTAFAALLAHELGVAPPTALTDLVSVPSMRSPTSDAYRLTRGVCA